MLNYQLLKKKVDEFGDTAKKVNDSSKLRKTHSEEAMKFISMSRDLGKILLNEIESVAEANIKHRDQDNLILNTCSILNCNLDRQKNIIAGLLTDGYVSFEVKTDFDNRISSLENALNKASVNLQEIIQNDNRIIFKDKYLIFKKKSQMKSLENLYSLADMILTDSENAIKGSATNLQRGLQMVDRFNAVDDLVKSGNKDELNMLLAEAHIGWKTAMSVNKNSSSQLEFAEKVNRFTRQLLEDSVAIKGIVNEKHLLFEENLKIVIALNEGISMEFKKYFGTDELISKIAFTDSNEAQIGTLSLLIKIATEDVKFLASLNYNMTDSIQLNNENETKTVSMSDSEVRYFNKITTEVSQMTEATRYPIEGSAKNIENGKILEKELKSIIDSI